MDQSTRRTGSPTSNGTAMQRYNLTRAALSLNSMRYEVRNDSQFYGRLGNTSSGTNVTDRCQRLQSKINEISVSAAINTSQKAHLNILTLASDRASFSHACSGATEVVEVWTGR